MKKTLLNAMALVLVLFSGPTLYAENERTCATVEYNNQQMQANPEFAKNRMKIEQFTQEFAAQNPNYKSSSLITIPVVVHVLYANAAQNISDARIIAQIEQLNADYTATNSDVGTVPAVFTSLVGNSNVNFCLAQRDPSGSPTNGIIRKSTTVTSWSTNDAIKYSAQGGDDAWPAGQYLNLWVGNLGGGLLGYAQFPGGPAATDGVVVLYGSVGSLTVPGTTANFNYGRTATHEVGHWLNLYHINGDSNCGNDQVADTPTQDQLHFGCPTHPYHVNACAGQSPNGEMFMNYMDYVNDNCMKMFSVGQCTRMNTCLAGPRVSLQSSQGCVPVVLVANDAGISGIVSPTGNLCATTINPVVTLKNYGSNALTSVTINYQVDAGPISNYNWAGSLATNATANVPLSAMGVTSGAHTFNATTVNPNGTSDQNTSNDGNSSNFNSIASGQAIPFQEGFEVATFPPTGWTIYNPDASVTWARTTAVAKTGVGCMWMDNANYASNGQIDEITLQALDLTALPNPDMTFQVAYTYWTVPYQYSDTLEILISTNCGSSWTTIYKKWGNALATAPGQSSDFFPTSSQWRLETVSLAAYASSTNALIKFRNITDYENNMFVDDINIQTSTGVSEIAKNDAYELYPNPTTGILYFKMPAAQGQDVTIEVSNEIGQVVYSESLKKYDGVIRSMDLTKLSSGIYILNVKTNSGNSLRKFNLTR